MYGLITQVSLSKIIHAVTHLGLQEVVGNHRVPHRFGKMNAIVSEDFQVILDVLPHLEYGRVLINKSELLEDGKRLVAILWNRDVIAFILLDGETQTNQFGTDSVGRCGLGV